MSAGRGFHSDDLRGVTHAAATGQQGAPLIAMQKGEEFGVRQRRVGLGVYNILNRHADAAEFWYIDRLPGEPAAGIADVHAHPLEPLSARLTVSKSF